MHREPHAGGRRLALVALVVVVAVPVTLISTYLTVLKTNLDYGSTFGGYGAAPGADLDFACADRNEWNALIPLVGIPPLRSSQTC
jgi:hypothetical protein